METKFSKQRIYKYSNGATLIYEPNEFNHETDTVIGFKSGSRCDGQYPGLTHLFEHLSSSASNGWYTEKEMSNIENHLSIKSNARTTYEYVSYQFLALSEYFQKIFEMNMDKISNKDFGIDRIRKEAKIIEEEIIMRKSNSKGMFVELNNDIMKLIDIDNIIGDVETLKTITPKVLKEYSEKYLVGENMVVSISSSLPFEEIVKITSPFIQGRFPSKPENEVFDTDVVDLTKHKQRYVYDVSQTSATTLMFGFVNNSKNNTEINNSITSEIFYNIYNGFSGKLYTVLRLEKELMYASEYKCVDLNNCILDCFNLETSGNKVNEAITSLAEIIKGIREKGITQEEFDRIKHITYINSQKEPIINNISPSYNFIDYIMGKTVFKYAQIFEAMDRLSLDDVNKLIKERLSPISIRMGVKGDFDIPNTITMEKFMSLAFNGCFEEYLKNNPYYKVGDNPAVAKEIKYYDEIQRLKEEDNDSLGSAEMANIFKMKAKEPKNKSNINDYEMSPIMESSTTIQAMLDELDQETSYRKKVDLYNKVLKEYEKFGQQLRTEKIDLVLEKSDFINDYVLSQKNIENYKKTNEEDERKL